VRFIDSFESAIRDAHDAKTSPARAKVMKTAVRALVTRSRGIVEVVVVMAGVADNAVSSAGCRVLFRGRIDSIESIRYCVCRDPHSSNDRGAAAHPA